jgi:hypothetical protein
MMGRGTVKFVTLEFVDGYAIEVDISASLFYISVSGHLCNWDCADPTVK